MTPKGPIYKISQSGIEALNTTYATPTGDWEQRYGHILLSDFRNLYKKSGLLIEEVAALYGTIGLEYFNKLVHKGYFIKEY